MNKATILYDSTFKNNKKYRFKKGQDNNRVKMPRNKRAKQNYQKNETYCYSDWNKENQIDFLNSSKENKFSFYEKKLYCQKKYALKESALKDSEKMVKKLSFDKTEDSSNKASSSSCDEKESSRKDSFILDNTSSPTSTQEKNKNTPLDISDPFNKFNKLNYQKINKKLNKPNPKKENTVILNVNIKIADNQIVTFKLRKYDDLYKTVSFFCEVNHINEKLIKPIILKTFDAMNNIYSLFNSKIGDKDSQLLKQIQRNDF